MAGTAAGMAKAREVRKQRAAERRAASIKEARLARMAEEANERAGLVVDDDEEQPEQPEEQPTVRQQSLLPANCTDDVEIIGQNQAFAEATISSGLVDAAGLMVRTVRDRRVGLPIRLKVASELLALGGVGQQGKGGQQPQQPTAAAFAQLAQALSMRNRTIEATDAAVIREETVTPGSSESQS